MATPLTIEEALRQLQATEGVTRVDIGFAGYGECRDNPFGCTVWYDLAPTGHSEIGCSSERGATLDDAVEAALADKAATISRAYAVEAIAA